MIDACGIAPEDTQAMRIRNAMQIAALTRADRKKELLEAYREQDRIYARIRAEQKNLYRYLKELVTLISSLRNAQADVMKERETLTHLAETDALTLLANRYALNNHLEVSYERTYKNKKSLCVCLLDLDDLKQYNDTHGHAAGDALLCRFAENLSRLAKEYGLFCARYGGDEFVLIGENKTSVRIGQMLNELRAAGDAKFSAGFCNRVPDDKSRPWDFLARADKNMYASKGRKDFSLIS